MTRFVDAVITYRILKKLVTPFEETDAYRLGIIDKKGNLLKKSNQLHTDEERDAYTLLDRLVFRLKRIINKVPVENKRFVSIAAALSLVREHMNDDREPVFLESEFISHKPDQQSLNEVAEFFAESKLKSFALFLEDGGGAPAAGGPAPIANSVGGGFSGQANINPNPNLAGRDIIQGKMARRKKPQLVGLKPKK